MQKRIIALFTAFFVLISSTAFAAKKDLKEVYNKNLRIGLKNMLSSSIKVTFNGTYREGSNILSTGTSTMLSMSNGKILYNGLEYSEITFTPDNIATTMTLEFGSRKYNYIGSMTFRAQVDGNILPINMVDIETYLKGVVGYEMSNSYPIEALKTQAVAARNYALVNIDKHGSEGYDLCDGTSCQAYRGYTSSQTNVIRAVEETKGMVLVYNDSLVSGYYSASNGGFTESSRNAWGGEIPYLQAREDTFDLTKWPSGDKTMTTADINAKLKSKGKLSDTDTFVKLNLETIQRNESNRISNIEIVYRDMYGVELTKSITKESAWSFLSLPSSLYTITYDVLTDTYLFSGMGNGHGVGMSQIGSKNRANAGQKYDEILTFYYMGTSLKSINDIIEGFSISKYEAIVGETISFTAKTSSVSSLFKYTVEQNGQVIYTRDYSADPSASYKVDRDGYFTVHLYSKGVNSYSEYDEHKTVSFSAISLLEISAISILNDSAIVKKPTTVNVDIIGAAAGGVEYKYEIEKDHIVFHSGTSDTSSFTFTPAFAGEYTVYVTIRDKAGNKPYNDMANLKIVVKATTTTPTTPTGTKPPVVTPATTVKYKITRTLKKGLSGADVKTLQVALKTLGYFSYPSFTTYFGDVTVNAVKAFQKKSGLTVNGVVETKTAAAINSALIAKASTGTKTTTKPTTTATTTTTTTKPVVTTPATTVKPSATTPVVTTKPVVTTTTKPTASNTSTSKFVITRNLKAGMSGNDVKLLQEALRKLGTYTYSSITGYYGPITASAVMAFQKAIGISATGIVDAKLATVISQRL